MRHPDHTSRFRHTSDSYLFKVPWIFLKEASELTRLAWKLMEKASRGEVSCVVTLPPCITILASYVLFEILLLDSCKSADVLEIVATLMLACCTQHSALFDAPTQGFQYLLWPKYLAFLSLVIWNNSFFEIQFFVYIPLNLCPLNGPLICWRLPPGDRKFRLLLKPVMLTVPAMRQKVLAFIKARRSDNACDTIFCNPFTPVDS